MHAEIRTRIDYAITKKIITAQIKDGITFDQYDSVAFEPGYNCQNTRVCISHLILDS